MGHVNMDLRGKSAVVYGGSSPEGEAVARSIAQRGAAIFLGGRSLELLEPVVEDLRREGAEVRASLVDPLNDRSVERHLTYVLGEHGSLDLSINLAFLGMGRRMRLTGLAGGEFIAEATTRVRSNFVTAVPAAREMAYQGHGVILAASNLMGGLQDPNSSGLSIGSAAIELLCHQLALEVRPRGVQVSCLRTGENLDPTALRSAFDEWASGTEEVDRASARAGEGIVEPTPLPNLARVSGLRIAPADLRGTPSPA